MISRIEVTPSWNYYVHLDRELPVKATLRGSDLATSKISVFMDVMSLTLCDPSSPQSGLKMLNFLIATSCAILVSNS